MVGGDLVKRTSALKPAMLALPLWLAGCISPVNYGEIRHSEYVADSRCDPAENLAIEVADKRSEEHTSELQSRENLVCRLLLEKKKKLKQHRFKDALQI